MSLQRISEFAENQEGKAFLLVKRPRKPPDYIRKFSPK